MINARFIINVAFNTAIVISLAMLKHSSPRRGETSLTLLLTANLVRRHNARWQICI